VKLSTLTNKCRQQLAESGQVKFHLIGSYCTAVFSQGTWSY
jgi:dihydroxyacetone kinase